MKSEKEIVSISMPEVLFVKDKVIEGNCYCKNSIVGKDGKCSYCGGNNPKEINKTKKVKK